MKYPNAYKGEKKLLISEILNVIASAGNFAVGLLIVIIGSNTGKKIEMAMLITALVATFVGIIAFIIQLIGLNQARKDEPQFKTALIFAVVGIAASAVFIITSGSFANFFSGINEVATQLVGIYTILGIHSLALKLGDKKIEKWAKIATVAVAVVFAFAVMDRLIVIFNPHFDTVMDICCSGLELFAHVIFLVMLAHAKTMLSRQ